MNKMNFRQTKLQQLAVFILLASALWALMGTAGSAQAQAPNYLHTEGSALVDANGNRVVLTGINWFGLETESYAPHGLWARSLESMLDQIQELGFNTIRLPYSNQLFDPSSLPNSVNYDLNPDLEGLTGLEIMDKVIEGAGARGIRVILDRHRPGSSAQSELWYTAAYDEERWIADWVMLAERYKGNDTVIGMDLHNEPHGSATWGSEDPTTDWRLAAERAGNAILAVNPNLLIIVQGVERYQDDWYWWGGNLMGAGQYPVRLDQPGQLVYSTHVYGPGVYPQPWFSDPTFPDNLPAIWDAHWGYLNHENIAPVIVGEFGGRSVGDDPEGTWQRMLVSYLRDHNLSYFYWTLNPNSGDTGGLLLDDWQSVDEEKEALLSDYQYPSIGAAVPTSEPAEALPTAAPVEPQSLRVQYRTVNTEARSQDSKPEFIIYNTGPADIQLNHIELFYWLSDPDEGTLVFHCDWAAVSCGNVVGDFATKEDGQQYLRLSFRPSAGALAAGQDSGEIKIRFNRNDWSLFEQSDDYSYEPVGDYMESDRVTLYVDGQPVWGSEPGSSSIASDAEPTTPPTPPPASATAPGEETVAESPTEAPPAAPTQAAPAAEPEQPAPAPSATVEPENTPDSPLLTSSLVPVLAGIAILALLGLGIIIGLALGRNRG